VIDVFSPIVEILDKGTGDRGENRVVHSGAVLTSRGVEDV
jgi:hypothetical protein